MTFAEVAEQSGAEPDKLAVQVARRIEDEIVAKRWPIGEILGSETELRERFGVSRSVLRESIRLLEHHQIASMRRGPKGGLLVCAPNASPATRALVIYLEFVGTGVDDLLQVRLLLEPLAARLAVRFVNEEGIAQLREADRLKDPIGSPEPVGVDFHVTLAELSGNALLRVLTEVLSRLTARYAITGGYLSADEVSAASVHAAARHLAIGEAIIGGDAAGAEALLTTHLTEVGQWLLAHRDRQSEPMHHRPVDPNPDDEPGRKLAERLAGHIHDDIAAGGRPVGDIFGSESDLLNRYRVSQSVLREAIRILEYHNVARMRRGHGGGLVILAPDPIASTSTIALYLDHRGATSEHLWTVREALEVGCLQAIAAAGRLNPGGLPAAPAWASGADGTSDGFHAALADLAGNPVLTVFLRVLRRLSARPLPGWPVPEAQSPEQTERAHGEIVQAMLAGDDALAQNRLRRHLAADPTCWR